MQTTLHPFHTEEPSLPEGTDIGDVYDILRNTRRRSALYILDQTEQKTIDIGEMAQKIASQEANTTSKMVSSTKRKTVYTSLQQNHLPKMDEVGLIKYDRDRGIIEKTKYTDEVTIYLEIVPQNEFPWSEYYLAVGAILTSLAAVIAMDITPFETLSPTIVIALTAIILVISSLIHIYTERKRKISSRIE